MSTSDVATLVKQAVDIVDVIGQFVPLRRVGNRHVGLCPFHQEKTASFQVDATNQFFYCFGCGSGGDVLRFVMKHQNLPFGDALKYLADRYNIPLPERDSGHSAAGGVKQKQFEERNQLYQVLELATDFFYRRLHHSAMGKVARDYLVKRSLPASTVEKQRMGYAPNSWDSLLKHMEKSGLDPELGVTAGFLVKSSNNRLYDRFRNRLIFPITDDQNHVVAFGGRSLDNSEPKYLNSPESSVYHKGRMLYQTATAREACRQVRQVILVEGYMDLLAFHAQDFYRVVATLGTALTPHQTRLLARLADEVVLVYDADEAGDRATLRALPLFLKEQLTVTCLHLPDGMDPDDFLRAEGLPAFESLLQKRHDLGTYAIERALAKWDGTLGSKPKVLNEVQPILESTTRSTLRSEYLRLLSERLRLSEAAILRHLRFSNKQQGTFPTFNVSALQTHQTRLLEESVVRIMVKYPELIEEVKTSDALECFHESQAQLLNFAHSLLQVPHPPNGNFDPNMVYDSLSNPELKELLTRFLLEEEDPNEGLSFARLRLDHDLRALREREGRKMPRNLHEALREAEQRGDTAQMRHILKQMKDLCSARKGVKGTIDTV